MEILDAIQEGNMGYVGSYQGRKNGSGFGACQKTDPDFCGWREAQRINMRLTRLGCTVYVVGETITPALWRDDVFIGASGLGCGAIVVNDAQKARKTGCTILAVTSKRILF
ncbi:MAG: hypothetical protein LBG43_07570 [Treponema sp.]|jgi:hypothetical protein|nr:hypothetical protein [Treponema sp.]